MEKERLLFCLERYDHYFDSVNNKSSVFLGLSTFIVGGLVAGYFALPDQVRCSMHICVFMALLIILGIVNMIIVISSATPFLSKDKDSLYYFGAISCKDNSSFCTQSISRVSEEEELKDLRDQVHNLATGLSNKFRRLRTAGNIFKIQFILFIPLFIFIITNLN